VAPVFAIADFDEEDLSDARGLFERSEVSGVVERD
jgi:hypothetical protein